MDEMGEDLVSERLKRWGLSREVIQAFKGKENIYFYVRRLDNVNKTLKQKTLISFTFRNCDAY